MDLKKIKLTEKRMEILKRLDIDSVEGVLSYYPYRYEEIVSSDYANWKVGDSVAFEGELLTSPSTFRFGKRNITRFRVLLEEEEIAVTIFNRPWARMLKIGEHLTILGKFEGNNKVTATNYYQKPIHEVAGIQALYSVKEGMRQSDVAKIVAVTYEKVKEELVDEIPEELILKHRLISYPDAIREIHFPSNKENLQKAIVRLKYEEFLRFYLSLSILKGNAQEQKCAKVFPKEKIEECIQNLPFPLTEDQKTCIEDVLKDLASNHTMTRLVQGDVGSGKTVVAAIALYACTLAGYQGALMVPTEILAKQHYLSMVEMLTPFGLRVEALYSEAKDARKIKEDLKKGEIDIIIGTHALFSKDVEYHDLGLVIADEQHRFGVRQRRSLKEKGKNVDFLLMSATPIPRTLASSIYGDMDISTIETMPEGRKGCDTYLIQKNSVVDILDHLKEILKEGRQIYLIAAAIEKSENYSAKDATTLYRSLLEELRPYRLGLLHGKMLQEEKDRVMKEFLDGEIHVLVSTTVVEVGVNVKNATCMVVYDADRFGLSQLHQLRGRVQRSHYRGSFYLLTNSKDPGVLKRLSILCESNDGFYIAHEDLKLRGPGDILGTRQSGIPTFILGNLIEDTKFIDAAKSDAGFVLAHPENKACQNLIDKIYEFTIKKEID